MVLIFASINVNSLLTLSCFIINGRFLSSWFVADLVLKCCIKRVLVYEFITKQICIEEKQIPVSKQHIANQVLLTGLFPSLTVHTHEPPSPRAAGHREEYLLGKCCLCAAAVASWLHMHIHTQFINSRSVLMCCARGWCAQKNIALPKHRPSIKQMQIFLVRHVVLSLGGKKRKYKDEKCRI